MSDRMPEDMPDRMPEDLPDRMPEDMPDRMPNRMSEDMSDRMPEDVPVRTCINVIVGITRSKVFFLIRCLRALSNGIGPGAQAHGTHAICHAEFSMFRRIKFGTINASQLFFQGSYVFSIFKLRIHACNKNKITKF